MKDITNFFTENDEKIILDAIREAESQTSGEIRVRIDKKTNGDEVDSARKAFELLGMRNTELHNGVLFYLATEEKKFVILGDDGINEKVPNNFWVKVKDVVLKNFRKNDFAKGLAEGIILAGQQLSTFFPLQNDDINELPDAISYSEDGDVK